ncbi:MAG: hypothetical protein JXA38_04765, partial [Methanosarcinaceae archaeon]|nr:hypothetical protein [Methanosarcinaceae archaeon]
SISRHYIETTYIFLYKIENILMLCWDITPFIPHLTKGDFSAYKLNLFEWVYLKFFSGTVGSESLTVVA